MSADVPAGPAESSRRAFDTLAERMASLPDAHPWLPADPHPPGLRPDMREGLADRDDDVGEARDRGAGDRGAGDPGAADRGASDRPDGGRGDGGQADSGQRDAPKPATGPDRGQDTDGTGRGDGGGGWDFVMPDGGLRGEVSPYQPWFWSSAGLEPWFSPDPGDHSG